MTAHSPHLVIVIGNMGGLTAHIPNKHIPFGGGAGGEGSLNQL